MADTLTASRSQVIFGVCVPLAVLVSCFLARPLESPSLAIVVLVVTVLLFPLLVRWYHPLLIITLERPENVRGFARAQPQKPIRDRRSVWVAADQRLEIICWPASAEADRWCSANARTRSVTSSSDTPTRHFGSVKRQ